LQNLKKIELGNHNLFLWNKIKEREKSKAKTDRKIILKWSTEN